MKVINLFAGEYSFLSNFYPAEVILEGIRYPTAEHAYQAAKTNSRSEKYRIADLDTPSKAKRAGRKLRLRSDWERVKLAVMDGVVATKFFSNPDIAQKLIQTGEATLIEGNGWGDVFWGVCNGVGRNELGKILMEVRKDLQEHPDVPDAK